MRDTIQVQRGGREIETTGRSSQEGSRDMKWHKKIAVPDKVIVKIMCDKCEMSVTRDDDPEFQWQEFHHIDFMGGYGSAFGDMAVVDCDLCSKCLYETIKDIARIDIA